MNELLKRELVAAEVGAKWNSTEILYIFSFFIN